MGFAVIGLDHVQLAMPPGRESEAEAFYAGFLGFVRIPKPEPMAGRGGCWFASGPVAVHLGVEADFRPARKAHPALVVRDLAGLAAAAAAGNIDLRPKPSTRDSSDCRAFPSRSPWRAVEDAGSGRAPSPSTSA